MNPPTAAAPVQLRCTGCDGDGVRGLEDGSDWVCPDCKGSGLEDLTGCPFAQVPADVWLAVKAARYASPPKEGGMSSWPVDGGWLEQTAIGLAAIEQARLEMALWKRRQQPDADD